MLALALGIGSGLMSLAGNSAANEQLARQQEYLIKNLEGSYKDVQGQMAEANRASGMALTNLEREALSQQAKMIAAKANSGVAGMSAFYMATNLMQQKAIASGNAISKNEAQLREEGRRAIAKRNQAQSGVNDLQAQKKSSGQMLFEAVMAGAQGYAMGSSIAGMSGISGVSSSASFGSQGASFMTNGAYTGPYSTFTGGTF